MIYNDHKHLALIYTQMEFVYYSDNDLHTILSLFVFNPDTRVLVVYAVNTVM